MVVGLVVGDQWASVDERGMPTARFSWLTPPRRVGPVHRPSEEGLRKVLI